jgi:hypothetical protein
VTFFAFALSPFFIHWKGVMIAEFIFAGLFVGSLSMTIDYDNTFEIGWDMWCMCAACKSLKRCMSLHSGSFPFNTQNTFLIRKCTLQVEWGHISSQMTRRQLFSSFSQRARIHAPFMHRN